MEESKSLKFEVRSYYIVVNMCFEIVPLKASVDNHLLYFIHGVTFAITIDGVSFVSEYDPGASRKDSSNCNHIDSDLVVLSNALESDRDPNTSRVPKII